MKTFSAKPKDIKRSWYLIDASEIPVGRLATKAASLLIGKAKPSITPHMDGGDYVVVINAANLVATGNKLEGKKYYRHSGYPGGLYQRTLGEQKVLDPKKVIQKAVKGMLPDNKLRPSRMLRLKIYEDAEHGHEGQNPEKLLFKGDK